MTQGVEDQTPNNTTPMTIMGSVGRSDARPSTNEEVELGFNKNRLDGSKFDKCMHSFPKTDFFSKLFIFGLNKTLNDVGLILDRFVILLGTLLDEYLEHIDVLALVNALHGLLSSALSGLCVHSRDFLPELFSAYLNQSPQFRQYSEFSKDEAEEAVGLLIDSWPVDTFTSIFKRRMIQFVTSRRARSDGMSQSDTSDSYVSSRGLPTAREVDPINPLSTQCQTAPTVMEAAKGLPNPSVQAIEPVGIPIAATPKTETTPNTTTADFDPMTPFLKGITNVFTTYFDQVQCPISDFNLYGYICNDTKLDQSIGNSADSHAKILGIHNNSDKFNPNTQPKLALKFLKDMNGLLYRTGASNAVFLRTVHLMLAPEAADKFTQLLQHPDVWRLDIKNKVSVVIKVFTTTLQHQDFAKHGEEALINCVQKPDQSMVDFMLELIKLKSLTQSGNLSQEQHIALLTNFKHGLRDEKCRKAVSCVDFKEPYDVQAYVREVQKLYDEHHKMGSCDSHTATVNAAAFKRPRTEQDDEVPSNEDELCGCYFSRGLLDISQKCSRCIIAVHSPAMCTNKVYFPNKRCPTCGSLLLKNHKCLPFIPTCGRCFEKGHTANICSAAQPKFKPKFKKNFKPKGSHSDDATKSGDTANRS